MARTSLKNPSSLMLGIIFLLISLEEYSSFMLPKFGGIVSKSEVANQPAILNTGQSRRILQLSAKKKNKSKSFTEEDQSLDNKVLQKEADRNAAALLELCGQATRPIEKIQAIISDLQSSASSLKPAQSAKIYGDWRLVFIDQEEALEEVGTGLHKLPLTRMEDLFWTFSGGRRYGRQIEAIEVLRILGPFPNVRNTLSGTYKISGAEGISITYTEMVDGTGKMIQAGNAAMERVTSLKLLYVGNSTLVLTTSKDQILIFNRETDLAEELRKLRVD